MENTIAAVNYPSTDSADVKGEICSQGHNLVGITNGSGGWILSDLTGSTNAPLEPHLGPLQSNGGPTFTMALLPGSPAIDAAASVGLATDQRGRLRPVDNPAITNAGANGSDIGAFEFQSQPVTLAGPMKRGDGWTVSFTTEVSQRYRLERTDALSPGSWTTVADDIAGTGGIVQVIDRGEVSQSKRFYRAQTLP